MYLEGVHAIVCLVLVHQLMHLLSDPAESGSGQVQDAIHTTLDCKALLRPVDECCPG